MSKFCFVGNFDVNSVGEPEIAYALEREGHQVDRVPEQSTNINELRERCQDADILLFAKFRVGTPKEIEAFFKELKIPKACWVFDLFWSL